MITVRSATPFVPPEWIEAHGALYRYLTPNSIPRQATAPAAEGLCPCARALTALADHCMTDLLILSTGCDQMRRIAEFFPADRIFLFNMPSMTNQAAFKLYVAELRRLGRRLEALGGISPSDRKIRNCFITREIERDRLRRDPRGHFAGLLGRLHWFEKGGDLLARGPAAEDFPELSGAVPLAIAGGCLLDDPLRLYACIEQAGGKVVLDAGSLGDRVLPPPASNIESADLLPEIARIHFSIPDIFRRPDTHFYEWMTRGAKLRGARGLILWSYPWCDDWRAQAPVLRERLGLPLLHLELADATEFDGPVATRIQAFLEMLK